MNHRNSLPFLLIACGPLYVSGQCTYTKRTATESSVLEHVSLARGSRVAVMVQSGPMGVSTGITLPGDSTAFYCAGGGKVVLGTASGDPWRITEEEAEVLSSFLVDSLGAATQGRWSGYALNDAAKESLRAAFECILATLPNATGSAPITYTEKPREFVKVIQLDSTRKADAIYRDAKRWFVEVFKDAQEVIQLDDPVSRTVVGKGAREYSSVVYYGSAVRKGWVRYSLEVIAKDGRCRMRIYDYRHEGSKSYSGGTVGGPENLGLIYDAPNCFPESSPRHTKHVTNVCAKEIVPQLSALEEDMYRSLVEFMSQSNTGPKDDW